MKKAWQRYSIILIALLLMFVVPEYVTISTLNAAAVRVLGIFLAVLLLWLNVGIDWPSILLLFALATVPALGLKKIIASSFGNTQFVFLLFTFIVTYALSTTGYLKKIATAFITSKAARKGPWHFIILYFASILFIGSFISPTVLFFIYLPMLEEIVKILNLKKGDKVSAMLMMGTVITVGISSGMTPIAHIFPLIALGLYSDMTGLTIGYGRYMLAAVPTGLLVSSILILVFKYLWRPDLSQLKDFKQFAFQKEVIKSTLRERLILAIFILVVCLWTLPDLLLNVFHAGMIFNLCNTLKAWGSALPPLIGIILLCLVEINDQPLLKLNEAMKNGVSWPSLLMFAGTLALGSALTDNNIGLINWLSNSLSPLIAGLSPLFMVFVFSFWAAVQTNVSSNMVTATVVSAAALAIIAGIKEIDAAALIINIGMMASYAFATPPAMPCVAVAISSGYVKAKDMLKYGFLMMFASVIVVSFIIYPLSI